MQILVQALSVDSGAESRKLGGVLQESRSGEALFAELFLPELNGEGEVLPETEPVLDFSPTSTVTSETAVAGKSMEVAAPVVAELSLKDIEIEPTQLGQKTAVQSAVTSVVKGLDTPVSVPQIIETNLPVKALAELPSKLPDAVPEGSEKRPIAPAASAFPAVADRSQPSISEGERQLSFAVRPEGVAADNVGRQPVLNDWPLLNVIDENAREQLVRLGKPPEQPNSVVPNGVAGEAVPKPMPTLASNEDNGQERSPDIFREKIASPVSPVVQSVASEKVPENSNPQKKIAFDVRTERQEGVPIRAKADNVPVANALQSSSGVASSALAAPAASGMELGAKPLFNSQGDKVTSTPDFHHGQNAVTETEATKPQASTVPRADALARPVMQQVQQLMLRANLDGMIEVKLSPEELGRVRLAMSQVESGMSVQITAERPETLDLLRRNIDLLESELRDQGFENLSFSFGQGAREDQGESDDTTQLQERSEAGVRAEIVTKPIVAQDGRVDIRL